MTATPEVCPAPAQLPALWGCAVPSSHTVSPALAGLLPDLAHALSSGGRRRGCDWQLLSPAVRLSSAELCAVLGLAEWSWLQAHLETAEELLLLSPISAIIFTSALTQPRL